MNQSTAVSALLPTIATTLCGVLAVGVLPVRGQDIPLELRGTVVSEETGRPLAGALVAIGPSSPPAVYETDGSYVIRAQQRSLNHPAGVQAFLPGYLPEERFEVSRLSLDRVARRRQSRLRGPAELPHATCPTG